MIKRRLNLHGRISGNPQTGTSSTAKEETVEWEMRPGGMLVQKRTENSDVPAPNLGVRVVYGMLRYEISVNSRSTFGELKKLLITETHLQPSEMKLIFRGRERENGEYLDMSGVKDQSKVILMEDPLSKERRFIEMRKNAKIQSVYHAISDVSMEVDKLAEQVSAIGKSIANGNKVAEVQITTLTEMLMRQAVKLDCISSGQGDDTTSAQKKMEGKRVQKCVETLDVLKVSNARVIKLAMVTTTTKWETFDPPPPPPPSATSPWEFFE